MDMEIPRSCVLKEMYRMIKSLIVELIKAIAIGISFFVVSFLTVLFSSWLMNLNLSFDEHIGLTMIGVFILGGIGAFGFILYMFAESNCAYRKICEERDREIEEILARSKI
jgi:hypothetical protein